MSSSLLSSLVTGTTPTESLPTFSTLPSVSSTVVLSNAAVPTASIAPSNTTAPSAVNANVASTILVIARDNATAAVAAMGLNGYGIPFQTLEVPATGTTLPPLNSTTGGNFGGIMVASGVTYDTGTAGYVSALTDDQWNQLYAYQVAYGVRMVQWDLWPDSSYGVVALGGCCDGDEEQLFSFSNTSAFTQAGLKTGAGLSTVSMYHYPAEITMPENTTEIAQFASNAGFNTSTAAVINNFNGREQMVFFLPFAQDWSPTSGVLQHSYITWMTRGLYAGYRRAKLNTQIDDMFLESDIYLPNGTTYRVTPDDMATIAAWVDTINAKMPPGSSYHPEVGHNGNGNIEVAETEKGGEKACSPGSIEYDNCYCDTALEYEKPLGTGINVWPTTPTTYGYSASCPVLDPLEQWWANTSNRDQFFHITHTFTHLELDNATYSDALKEIQFNQAWLSQVGIAAGKFTANGLIPPAISGLHNGDALRAWTDAGLTHCVGDNTRPVLMNTENAMWPYITTVAADGFAGYQVNGRWATRIYYNCDTPNCTTQEWIDTSFVNATNTFDDLMATELQDSTRYMFGLYHDAYMFHQANLRNTGTPEITVNGVTAQISLFQAWVEQAVQEFTRLATWPIINEQQVDFSAGFARRMARDQCGYGLSYAVSNSKITGVTVTSNDNTCSEAIPVTFPGTVTNLQGFTTEQLGGDPLTVWVNMTGAPVSFSLSSPINLY